MFTKMAWPTLSNAMENKTFKIPTTRTSCLQSVRYLWDTMYNIEINIETLSNHVM